MKRLISAFFLFAVHFLSRIFFNVQVTWVGARTQSPWKDLESDLRVIAFLNHTSLWEPIFLAKIPYHFLWMMAGKVLIPGADKTLSRPLVGTFYKLLTPATIPISRKRDATWDSFLSLISKDKIVLLAPEGRMKRRNGLDSKGQKMSVRGGIGDILSAMSEGKMLICYSGGIHQVQAPGEFWPRLFQTVKIAYEIVDITQYKKQIALRPEPFKMAVAKDLEDRMAHHCPT